MSTKNEHVKIEKKNRTGIIILNRPEVLNALNTPMLSALRDSLLELELDENIRAVILRGGEHFCAGADLSELKDKNQAEAKEFSILGQGICNQIARLAKPVIAEVNGYALGGGCEIALSCDIRIAGKNARFGQPEVNIGIVPGWGGTQRLPGLVGLGKAMEMLMTGKSINANEAVSIGLVSIITEDHALSEKAEEMAAMLAEKSPSAMAKVKKLAYTASSIEKGLALEIELFSECFGSDDFRERIKALLAKR